MNSADEVYSPSAELARAHLRNAVVHLLRHAPVQGKAALSRVLDEVNSVYFPTEIEDVIVHFEHSALANPRESLVRNVVIVLLKTIVRDALDEASLRRHCAALNGIRRLYPGPTEAVMAGSLSRLIRDLSDARVPGMVHILTHVPGSWDFCEDDVRSKLERVVERLPEAALRACLPAALDLGCLAASAMKRIACATSVELCALVEASPRVEYVNQAIEYYSRAENDAAANSLGSQLLSPLAPFLAAPDVTKVFSCISSNVAVRSSTTVGTVLRSIRDSGRLSANEIGELVLANGLDTEFGWLLTPEQKEKRDAERDGAEATAEPKDHEEQIEGEDEVL